MRCLGPLTPPHMARIGSDPRLAGVQLPEPHLNLRQRLPEVDARLLALIYCCLQPDPQLRPTAAELMQMVRRAS
jgi:cyclin-dependent kinase-like